MKSGGGVVLKDTDDMALLRDAARRLLARHWPVDKAVALAEDPGELRRFWQEAVRRGGWPSALRRARRNSRWPSFSWTSWPGCCPIPLADALLARDILAADNTGDTSALAQGIDEGSVIPSWIFGPAGDEEGAPSFVSKAATVRPCMASPPMSRTPRSPPTSSSSADDPARSRSCRLTPPA